MKALLKDFPKNPSSAIKVENNKVRRLNEENSRFRDQIRDFEKEKEPKLLFPLLDHRDTENKSSFVENLNKNKIEPMHRAQEYRQKIEAIKSSEA